MDAMSEKYTAQGGKPLLHRPGVSLSGSPSEGSQLLCPVVS